MALNFSHPTIFPARLPEDNLVSPFMIGNSCLLEGVPERKGDVFVRPWHSVHDFYESGGDNVGAVRSEESVSKDIMDQLPADPFGMDFSSTFAAAITGLLEDPEEDCEFGNAEVWTSRGDCPLFAGLNLIWNTDPRFCSYSGNSMLVHKRALGMGITSCHGMLGNICKMGDDAFSNNGSIIYSETIEGAYTDCSGNLKLNDIMQVLEDVPCHGASIIACNMDNPSCCNGISTFSHTNTGMFVDVDSETPHDAILFALGYLDVFELLTVERVCKSLRCTVHNDPLLWRTIHIDQRLSERITDDILLQLTDRAQGNLQSLSLMECTRITDDGLKCVLERNLSLTKLGVAGCTRLSIDGVLGCLKGFNSVSIPGIKQLRIGGLYGMSERHFEDFSAVLGVNNKMSVNARKPHFYRRGNLFLSVEDDRAIDIEVCPRCQNVRPLYDCPAEEHSAEICRACIICIPRCVDCGRCINGGEFEETFCLELLCSNCGEQLLDCQVKASGPA